MKLISKAFTKWYLERDFQGVRLYDESGKQPERFKHIHEVAPRIIELRLMDEAQAEMDIADFMQLENTIKEEVFKALDPTGYLVNVARQKGLLAPETV